ncbi:nucleotidyltransferase domain-containing protein [Metallibacterium scheffleri]|uniref:DNA polymerase beta n=1 Tax=Metallibacterium scheffleri TaxID=993689 RepID=A0A4S3KM95_9GAMM|nr:nucleotidyltransferase domain-containing protein [Metallibacterium scheffleri]THD09538.1 DNA polymerase beta [Metallibacterium scheffleri]
MRLTPEQAAIIRSAAAEVFGSDARVWLFGSRVDDAKRGGDIDLLVQTTQTQPDALARDSIAMLARLQRALGEQKIDLILDAPVLGAARDIITTAKVTGVLL